MKIAPQNPKTHFREVIWDVYLKKLISELNQRFGPPQKGIFSLRCLIPGSLGDAGELGDIVAVLDSYHSIHKACPHFEGYTHATMSFRLTDHNEIKAEVTIWARRWMQESGNDLPNTCLTALSFCDPNFFPVVHFGLALLATCPATSCEAERSFSALKVQQLPPAHSCPCPSQQWLSWHKLCMFV